MFWLCVKSFEMDTWSVQTWPFLGRFFVLNYEEDDENRQIKKSSCAIGLSNVTVFILVIFGEWSLSSPLFFLVQNGVVSACLCLTGIISKRICCFQSIRNALLGMPFPETCFFFQRHKRDRKKTGTRQQPDRNERGLRQEWDRNETGMRQERDRNETGTRQEQDRNKTGTRQERDRNETGTRKEQGRNKTGTGQEWDRNVTGTLAAATYTIRELTL